MDLAAHRPSRAVYLAHSICDHGEVTADSQLADFAPSGLQSAAPYLGYRGAAGERMLQITLDRPRAMNTIALCQTNISPTAILEVRAWSDPARSKPYHGFGLPNSRRPIIWNSVPWNSVPYGQEGVATPGKFSSIVGRSAWEWNSVPWNSVGYGVDQTGEAVAQMIIIELQQTVQIQYFDLVINDPLNRAGYIHISRLKCGELVTPAQVDLEADYRFGLNANGFRSGNANWKFGNINDLTRFNDLIKSHGARPSELRRAQNGALLGMPDDVLWLGHHGMGGRYQFQHEALVAITDWTAATIPEHGQGVFGLTFEEIYPYE